jgi:hypothetical protein
MEFPAIRDRSAIVEIIALLIIIETGFDADGAAFDRAVLADEIDHRTGRIAGEGRGRTAAHDFDTLNVGIEPHEGVGRGEIDIAELQHR